MIAFSALAQVSGTPRASESPPNITRAQLHVTAFKDCATAGSIAAQVAKRSRRIELVDVGLGLPIFYGKIEQEANSSSRVIVELIVMQPTGHKFVRKLAAPNCEQGAEALALLITMTLDPVVGLDSRPEFPADFNKAKDTLESESDSISRRNTHPPSLPKPMNEAAGSEDAKTAKSKTEAPPQELTRDGLPSEEPKIPLQAIETPPQPPNVQASLGLWGSRLAGPAPRNLLGLGLYGFLAFDRQSPISFAFLVTISRFGYTRIVTADGVANFSLVEASLDICPFRITRWILSSRLCAASQIGQFTAAGSNTYDAQTHKRLFAALGGSALLQFRILASLELVSEIGLSLALTQHDFAFIPVVFYKTPPQVLRLGIGIGKRW